MSLSEEYAEMDKIMVCEKGFVGVSQQCKREHIEQRYINRMDSVLVRVRNEIQRRVGRAKD